MLFSSLANLLAENYTDVLYAVSSDCEITDVSPYKHSVILPASDCLSLFTPAQIAQESVLPSNILCIGAVEQELYQRIQGSGGNYILVPEETSSEIVCYLMQLFGNTIRQQKVYSDLIYMLYSDVDLGSIFSEFRRETGFQLLAIDVSGKVIAYSKPFVINHPNWHKSIEMGYLDQYLIEFIRNRRERNNMDMSTAPFSLYCNILKQYIKVVRVVADDELIGYVFMGGNTNLFPPYSDRLIPAFAKKLKGILISSGGFRSFRINMHQNILSDLIDGASEEEIIQRIHSANLTFPANMRVLVIKTSFYRGGANYLYSTLLPLLSSLLPETPKLIRDETIVVLLEVDHSGTIKPEIYQKLTELAKSHNLHIGISNAFSHPVEFPVYYHQAQKMQSIAKRTPQLYGLFYFSDFAFYILLDSIGDKGLLSHTKMPILDEIEAYDAEKNSALYETLKVYAYTGFSKNRTAEVMFLHRNTVNYRIQQLENLFSIDFSDPSLLFKLQYSFYIDSYLKKNYTDIFPRELSQPASDLSFGGKTG